MVGIAITGMAGIGTIAMAGCTGVADGTGIGATAKACISAIIMARTSTLVRPVCSTGVIGADGDIRAADIAADTCS